MTMSAKKKVEKKSARLAGRTANDRSQFGLNLLIK